MNQSRKLIALLLAVALLLAALPCAALAASYKVENLKLKKWLAMPSYSDDMAIYQLKVTGEAVVTFSWKNVKKGNNDCHIIVYRDKALNNYVAEIDVVQSPSSSDAFVLYGGTYYIMMYDENGTGKVKVTTRKAAVLNKANYCLSKAIALAGGKKVEIAQTRQINYDRWYKIKLTKKQLISFYFASTANNYFEVYNSKMNEISCVFQDNRQVTLDKQPKGTYFVKVCSDSYSNLNERGNYTAFYWK